MIKQVLKGGLILYLTITVLFLSCKDDNESRIETRTYRMGFQNSAPRQDFDLILQSLYMWTERSDAAIISTEVPWDSILSGTLPQHYIDRNYKDLVAFYRNKNLKLWVYIDPANGLDRSSDAVSLKLIGKSITQPDVQLLFRKFAFAMDSILKPEHLGLALETNLIRGLSPDSIYQSIKKVTNESAIEISEFDNDVKLSVSVQVDWAWGKMDNSQFKGIEQDLSDFPFISELGLSCYPFLVFDNPQEIPADYYSKIAESANLPVFISESGWTSATVNNYVGTPQKQKDYFIVQGQLLESVDAIAFFQLTFTDIDITSLPPYIPASINYFAHIGLVDTLLQPKPALLAWDELFSKRWIEVK